MSGRFALAATEAEIVGLFGKNRQLGGMHPMPPRHNIAPTQPILTIIWERSGWKARLMQWNFLPEWVKDPADFSLIPSARAETVEQKPSFKNAIRRRRCLIPASGFFEWKKGAGDERSQPYYITRKDKQLIAIAGLWECWMGPNGEEMDGVAMLTHRTKGALAQISDRCPVLIAPKDFEQWLDASSDHFKAAKPLVKPVEHLDLIAYPVSSQINSTSNDDASLLLPMDGSEAEQQTFQNNSDALDEQKRDDGADQLSLF